MERKKMNRSIVYPCIPDSIVQSVSQTIYIVIEVNNTNLMYRGCEQKKRQIYSYIGVA